MAAALPRMMAMVLRTGWQTDRQALAGVVVAQLGQGVTSAWGLIAVNSVLTQLFSDGPTADKLRQALPALIVLGLTAVAAAPGNAPAGTEFHIVGVHLHLQDERGRILLGLRHPRSTFAPSTWHFLAGHCEREAAIACLVREAKEEAGLTIAPEDVELVLTVHLVDSPNAQPRIGLVFRARSWAGDPEVLEPDRCVEWRWWNPQDLPAEVVPYTRQAIDGILDGRRYSEVGWGER
ncbi:NUDIX domain-containing protein [Streptomyces sp. NPDC057062]|uniref:NUDIX hydrolase n=1 Tax=unclassified Streptomyces TaxID=2593676 RepID=UPI0020769152|nr:NUDIX domain-containing protein [Streptomyces sp. MBT84]